MAYSDSIKNLKDALSGFSEEEKKLESIYKTAIENAEKEFSNSEKRLLQQYKRDRNEVYSDSAREERNLLNMLSHRGLGFSGESAQAKLNSDMILANRLSALAREKNESSIKLLQDFANRKNGIELESAQKRGDFIDKANQLKVDIAELELDKEMNDAKLRAEMKMLEKELAAKYHTNGGGGGGGDGENTEGYIPDISEKELAKLLISNASAGEQYINSEKQAYIVNKYLLDLKENYNLNSDYFTNLVLILKSYGYAQVSDLEMRTIVIVKDAEIEYNNKYNVAYDQAILEDKSQSDARSLAKKAAKEGKIDYIFKKSKNEQEFKTFCYAANISQKEINRYLNVGVTLPQYKPNGIGD